MSTHVPGHNPASSTDTLNGSSIEGNSSTVNGKMVDLDPDMQGLSQLFGVYINIKSESGEDHISGQILPCAFRDMWNAYPDNPDRLGQYGAVYESVLKLDKFCAEKSQFLLACEEYITLSKGAVDRYGVQRFPNGAVSVRLRVTHYNSDRDSQNYRYGDVLGCIEPWIVGEPDTFNSGRCMRSVTDLSAPAYFHLQENNGNHSIHVDYCNSLQFKKGGEYINIGTLGLYAFPEGYNPGDFSGIELLGQIGYDTEEAQLGGLVTDIEIGDGKLELIKSSPLGLIATKDGIQTVLVVEDNTGYFVKADLTFMRLNFREDDITNLYVTRFGERIASQPIIVKLPSVKPGILINGETPKNDSFQTQIVTNENGVASLGICGGDTGNPRGFIDGQVFGITYFIPEFQEVGHDKYPSDMVHAKVYDRFEAPEKPSWIGDILPIFKQYANLYPSMDRVVKLDDFGSVLSRREALKRAFSVDEDDPHYMPVTRDLSKSKRDMIVKWLSDLEDGMPLFMNVGNKEDLYKALQMAVELEHATIPPYLTALYSIKPGYNEYIAESIREVVEEEMSHMVMVCNIMIALGVSPNINKPGFVPKYPGPLPGGLRNGLTLRLRKCCKEQIRTFMDLEAPSKQRLEEEGQVEKGIIKRKKELQKNPFTIGYFYEQIKKSLNTLHEDREIQFPYDTGKGHDQKTISDQVTEAWPNKVKSILRIEDAMHAINVIMDEGEGATPTNPSDGEINEETGLLQLAHYFKFSEIYYGKRIVIHGNGFSYTGPSIEIDPEGVYNMQDDPDMFTLPENAIKARDRMEAFSTKYQTLLNALHVTFNGKPKYLGKAVALMFQLTMFAQPLMMMPLIEGEEFDIEKELEKLNEAKDKKKLRKKYEFWKKIGPKKIHNTEQKDDRTVGITFQLPLRVDEDM